MAKYWKLGNISCYKGKGKHGVLGGIQQWFGPGRNARIKADYLIWYPAYLRSVVYLRTVICGHFGLGNNRQNPVGIKGDAVCSLSVLRDRRLAVGILDQSWIVIKCKIIRVDTNTNPRRFWVKVKHSPCFCKIVVR